MDRYRALLGRPFVPALFGWTIVARLPIGMAAFALVLLVRDTGAGYGEAGLVAAAYTAAVAVGAPYAGRQVDRLGIAPALRLRAVGFPLLLAAAALLGALSAPVFAIGIVVAAAGVLLPPVASAIRTIWPQVVGDDDARTAYALEAALQELVFVGGPLFVAIFAAVWVPGGVLGAAAFAAIGTFRFLRLPPVRAAGPAEHRHRSPLGALSSPGVLTITLLTLMLGLSFATVEIAVPAFSEDHGGRALAGIPLAGLAIGSFVGGLLAGLKASSNEARRLLLASLALVAGLALPLLATSMGTMTVLCFFAGLPVAPLTAAAYAIIGSVAAAGSVAEAFAWFGTAASTGFAGGSVVSGWVIDTHGWHASILLGVGLACFGAVVVVSRWSTLLEPAPTPLGSRPSLDVER